MLQLCKVLFWVSYTEEIMLSVQTESPLPFHLLLLLKLSLLSNWVCHSGKAKPFRTMLFSHQCNFTAGLGTLSACK